jgi:hypothetical protein
MNPRFPIYIVSKGRWHKGRRLTARSLERMQVPYNIVVEESQYQDYLAATDPAWGTVLILDPAFQRDYPTLDRLGMTKSLGPGPARNFAWHHAIQSGAAWHWVMDDNLRYFFYLNKNQKIRVMDGTIFWNMEEWALRYMNLGMCGPAYESMTPRREKRPPYKLNTRIYSCNLIRNDLKFRWRGRYNEDTILSLDMMYGGWCTAQFNAFLQDKVATQKIKGGNTDEFYIPEAEADKLRGTLEKSRMLVKTYPKIARLVKRYDRWHHHVDYDTFKGLRLIRRPDAVISDEPNYNLRVVQIKDEPASRW